MTISPQRAKSILALVCLVLAFCLVQRSFNLPVQPGQPVASVSVAAHAASADEAASSDKPCALGAKSLSGSAPLLDTALPFLVLLLALIATLFQVTSATGYRRAPLFPPLRRRHLTLCVFRE
ncbi:hypothetical protein HA48_13470 [Pantoea wallisii]|uniref:Copper resistance protein n=1 Tax=Pantoea wallisii TaxID=1076551 RepID=A0A1X1D7M3_9GAMM|nr:hypothetical protein [Pantoea wallisii]ORM72685.1 hypothetical protein HA48_13470 [Pantoea wallisii]